MNKTITTQTIQIRLGIGLLFIVVVGIFFGNPIVVTAQSLGDGVYYYGIQSDTTPKTKAYSASGNSFGATSTTAVAAPSQISAIKASPTSTEMVAIAYDGASMYVQCFDGTTWSNEWTASSSGIADLGYETATGDVVVLYSTGATSTNELAYRTKAGSADCGSGNWSSATNLDPVRTSGLVQWIKIATDSRATSSLMTAIWADNNSDLSAMVWDGSAWGNEHTAALETSLEIRSISQDSESFDVAYESLSGDVMVVWGSGGTNGTNGAYYAVCTGGTSSCTWGSVRTAMPTFLDDATHISIAADPTSNQIVFASIGDAGSDLQYGIWSGTAWTNTANADTSAQLPLSAYMYVATGWLNNGSIKRAVVTYYDSTATNIGWRTASGTTWTTQTDATPTTAFGTQIQYEIVMNPVNKNELMFLVSNTSQQGFAKRLSMDGSGAFTWSEPDSGLLAGGLASNIYQSMDFAYWQVVPAVGAAISGVLYGSDRTTAAAAGYSIKLAVGTSSTPGVYSATTTSGGAWTFSSIDISAATSGTPYTIWLDGTSTKATTLLSGNASSSASDIRLYQGYLAVNGSTTASAVNLANFAAYDSTDDADVLYTISGSSATTTANFYIRQGDFTPTATFVIEGNYENDGTFTHNNGTVHFFNTAASQNVSGTLVGASAFYDIEFTSSSSASENLIAHWTFDEVDQVWTSSTTGTTTDVTGNGNDGGFVNMSTSTNVVAGYSGEALYFDGSNATVYVPPGSFNGLSTSSACVWINPGNPADAYGNIFSTYNALNATAGWELYVTNDGATLGIGGSIYTDGSYHTRTVNFTIPKDGTWTHVCGRFGGGTGTITLYKNGVDIGGTDTGSGVRLSDSGNGAFIGSFDSVSTYNYVGKIDELQFYNKYLTDDEVLAIYENGTLEIEKNILTNASTTHFSNNQGTVVATGTISIAGDYTNNGTFITGPGTTTFSGTSAQTATGTMTGTSAFTNLLFTGAGTKTIGANASTTNFTSVSGAGEIVMPERLTVSGSYTANNATTTYGGAVWTPQSALGDNDSWINIAYGNGIFVAVGSSSDAIMTSPDGITWTVRSTGIGFDYWAGVTYGNGRFVAVSISGERVITSVDGITWVVQSAVGYDDYWVSVTYGNGLFVAVGVSAGDRVMTSPDGVTWTAQSAAGDDDDWSCVTYGNGLFVAVGYTSDRVMTSPDGINWTVRSAAGNDDSWSSVAYGNGLFVAVASNGDDRVMTSPDGINWTVRSAAGNDDDWYGVTYGNGLFVAVGHSGSTILMTSPDGINWTVRSGAGDNDNWTNITYGNGRFVAIANGGGTRVMTALDGQLTMASSSPQVLSGNLTGAGQLRAVDFSGSGMKTFSSNASTTQFTVATSSSVTLPAALSIAGNYTNSGSVEAGTGVVYLSGSRPQTLSGSMTTTNAFNNLVVKNNSRVASTSFTSALTVDGTLTAEGSTYITLLSGATSTVANLTLNGSSTAPVAFGATATGTQAKFVLTGTPTVTYVTVYDNNACGSTGGEIDVSGGNNTDGGNLSCWNFTPPAAPTTIALADNEHFYVGEATTTLGTITVTEGESASVTAANDIRITIATTTTNFRFDVGETTLTYGGTASGKVANPVSYEDGGATLVIPVSSDFSAADSLTIDGVMVGSFASVSTMTSQLNLHSDGNIIGAATATTTETLVITGLLTISEHDAGQAENEFSWQNRTETNFFAFKLAPSSENATVTDMVISLNGIYRVTTSDLSNFKLYRDADSDGVLDGTDLLIDGSGVLTINGQDGAVTFSTDFLATTSANYIVIADTTSIPPAGAVVFSLSASGITGIGQTSQYDPYVLSTVSSVQHIRSGSGSTGAVTDRIGGPAPAGGGIVTGGGSGGGGGAGEAVEGENIVPDADFYRPTDVGTPSEWTNPTNAYASDGVYATASTNTFRQTYINFGFGIPGSNSIQGISVKLDASGSTAAGTIDVALSWDGGSSYTTAIATPTLSGSDIVYTVGGPADTWGRSWSVSEFSNTNFRLRVTANTSSNTLQIDALEVRIHHQATGGGSGGGGGI